ncbi:mitochondrial ribosomal protein L48 [Colletes latitarsis]|uniref:mitochondrial ribosomal protein L48 n=1 Tax=Colletes latitarsis TaxID=2605962 RepID=UPI0040351B7F
MALNIIKQVSTCCRNSVINKTLRFYSLYEPPYLKLKERGPPHYPTLNIQIKGYVFPLLESYQSFIHKIANILDVDIINSYPVPHQEYKIQKYKKASTQVDSEYILKLYERDMVVSNITSLKCPILIRLLEATLPEGVQLHIDTYSPEMENIRYIPDKELLDIQTELESLKKPK